MRRILGATTALLFGFGLAATAMAQGGPGGGPGGIGSGGGPGGGPGAAGPGFFMLQRFDTNGDGKVTEEEFRTGHEQIFTAIDTNGDGVVTAEEMVAYVNTQRANRKLSRMDADGDGKVTREEYEKYADARFARADANDDRTVTADELARGPGGRGPGGKGPGGGRGPAGGAAPQQ